MTVADNIGFDGDVNPAGLVPRGKNTARARDALKTLGLTISPSTVLGSLSTARPAGGDDEEDSSPTYCYPPDPSPRARLGRL